MRFLAEGVDATGELLEVSRAGVYVRSDEIPPPGTVLALQLRIPEGALVDLRGTVQWNTDGETPPAKGRGFGVVVIEPSPEYRAFFLWAQSQADEEKGTEPDDL